MEACTRAAKSCQNTYLERSRRGACKHRRPSASPSRDQQGLQVLGTPPGSEAFILAVAAQRALAALLELPRRRVQCWRARTRPARTPCRRALAGDPRQQPPSHACWLKLGRRAQGPTWIWQAGKGREEKKKNSLHCFCPSGE